MAMEKLIVTRDGVQLNELVLEGECISIGRDGDCDLPLPDRSVSRRHARLVRVEEAYHLQDLGSTNGTFLNSQPINEQVLQHADMLRIGSFYLQYLVQGAGSRRRPKRRAGEQPVAAVDATIPGESERIEVNRSRLCKVARLRFFRGPKAGLSDKVDRTLYTIGMPGGEVAAISRRPQGFFLVHIGGDRYPKINNREMDGKGGVKLQEGDVLEVGDVLAEITFV